MFPKELLFLSMVIKLLLLRTSTGSRSPSPSRSEALISLTPKPQEESTLDAYDLDVKSFPSPGKLTENGREE